MLITSQRKEYLLNLENLSDKRYTVECLSNIIEEVISRVGIDEFTAIISDNSTNVAAAMLHTE